MVCFLAFQALPSSAAVASLLPCLLVQCIAVFRGDFWARARPCARCRDAERDLRLRFLRSPAALLPAAGDATAVGGLRVEVMGLETEDGRQRAVGTGHFETLEVCRCLRRHPQDECSVQASRLSPLCQACNVLAFLSHCWRRRRGPQVLPHPRNLALILQRACLPVPKVSCK